MGKLITFEGIDGAGKTSLIEATAKKLEVNGYTVRVLQEPGTTDMGKEIRKLVKSDLERSKLSEILLFQASRSDMVERELKPALEKYDYVLLDRYIDSTIAYQGYGNQFNLDVLNDLNRLATNGCLPYKTLLIDVDLEMARERARKRGEKDKFDKDLEFAHRVYEGYQELSKELDRMIVIPNDSFDLALEDIYYQILN